MVRTMFASLPWSRPQTGHWSFIIAWGTRPKLASVLYSAGVSTKDCSWETETEKKA